MRWDFKEIEGLVEKDFENILSEKDLEVFRIKYLGRKGLIPEIYSSLAGLSSDEKPLVGKKANDLRQKISLQIKNKQESLKNLKDKSSDSGIDLTLPGVYSEIGHKHLITQTVEEICQIFEKMGFDVFEGPEIETEFYNFSALNIPSDHPSRDGFDTFYLDDSQEKQKEKRLLRSHTSPSQIRIMENYKPPLSVIVPGKVYRPDAVDASHSFMFHQIEGLLVDKDVKFSQLKGLLIEFCQRLFSKNIKMRFRPHFFPFTEPSAEVDIFWEKGKKDWLEIMGCGMVHPEVFKAVGYSKGKYTGLAFGLGVERIAMLKHGITDIRVFYDNDKRFLDQF